MSNWFEKHPLTTIIGHTALVASVISAAFLFVFDDNKVASAKAETDQYKAKTEVLEVEISRLREENRKYLDWMTATPNTIPHLESKIASLSSELAEAKGRGPVTDSTATNAPIQNFSLIYANSDTVSVGETFVDDQTRASLGIGRIRPDFTTSAILTLPSGETKEIDTARAGSSWRYKHADVEYQLQLNKVDWFSNKATVSVSQVPKGEP